MFLYMVAEHLKHLIWSFSQGSLDQTENASSCTILFRDNFFYNTDQNCRPYEGYLPSLLLFLTEMVQ